MNAAAATAASAAAAAAAGKPLDQLQPSTMSSAVARAAAKAAMARKGRRTKACTLTARKIAAQWARAARGAVCSRPSSSGSPRAQRLPMAHNLTKVPSSSGSRH